MGAPIPIEVNPTRDIEIDAALVAPGLGLEIAEFKRLMETRRITVLCERGTGEHAGLYRASFYHGRRRVRLVVDGEGTPVPGRVGEASPGPEAPR
jgi:hypothetical protein